MAHPQWLPALMTLNDVGGDWPRYLSAVYSRFKLDFLDSQPRIDGQWVRCRRDPIIDGKEAGFWHCTSEGDDERARTPDVDRMARVGWIRAIIEHCGDSTIDCWRNRRDGADVRQLLWFNEEYLVVLGQRKRKSDGFQYWMLITAYPTPQEHRKRKLRAERDEVCSVQKRLTPPP